MTVTLDGSGTAEDPYLIRTVSDFMQIRSNYSTFAYYSILNDLDFTGESWQCINAPAALHLIGNGKSIKNLTITANGSYTALFQKYYAKTVYEGIVFDNIIVNTTTQYSGILSAYYNAGYTVSQCVFKNCSVKSSFSGSTSTSFIGLVSGNAYGSTITVRNCIFVNNTVSSPGNTSSDFNGIVSGNSGNAYNIFAKDNTITALASNIYVGGIIGGSDRAGTISGCVSIGGSISASGTSLITGRIVANSATTLSNNYSNILVNGAAVTGGTVSNKNGADVSDADAKTQTFYEDTLGWDFTNIWIWDTANEMPALRVCTGQTAVNYTKTVKHTITADMTPGASLQWEESADGVTYTDITGEIYTTLVLAEATGAASTVEATALQNAYDAISSYDKRIKCRASVGVYSAESSPIHITYTSGDADPQIAN